MTRAAARGEVFSIEAAQPNLDLKTLDGLGDKTVILGVISMGDVASETPETVAAGIRAPLVSPPHRSCARRRSPPWMHEMRNGSARCLAPIEKPLRPVCAPSSAPCSRHPRENSTAVRAALWRPSRGSISTSPPTVRDVEFLRANTDRMIKITIPGPVYGVAPRQERAYKDEEELVRNYAAAARDPKAVGRYDPARRALTAALPTGERQPTCPRFWG